MVKTLISLLLWAFLAAATFFQGNIMLSWFLWGPQYSTTTHGGLWALNFLNPFGDPISTYQVYLLAYTTCLVWEAVIGRVLTILNGSWLGKIGSGEMTLLFWVAFEGFARYRLDQGLEAQMPPDLDETLALCAVLWMIQKIVWAMWDKWLSRATHSRIPIPMPAPDLSIEKPSPALRPQAEMPASAVSAAFDRGGGQGVDVPGSRIEKPTPKPSPKPVQRAQGRPPKESHLDLDRKMLDFIALKGQAKTGDLEEALGANRRTINRCQEKLVREGRLLRFGKGAGATYRIKAGPASDK